MSLYPIIMDTRIYNLVGKTCRWLSSVQERTTLIALSYSKDRGTLSFSSTELVVEAHLYFFIAQIPPKDIFHLLFI